MTGVSRHSRHALGQPLERTFLPMTKTRLLSVAIAASTIGTSPARAQLGPPSHPLGPVLARTKEHVSQQTGVVQLRDGRVLVNDPGSRRIMIFDSTLAAARRWWPTRILARRTATVHAAER